jgi:hypothetical protein
MVRDAVIQLVDIICTGQCEAQKAQLLKELLLFCQFVNQKKLGTTVMTYA